LEDGAEIVGAAELSFGPEEFPESLRNGLFIGFSGNTKTGVENPKDALVYFDGVQNVAFIKGGQAGVGMLLGLEKTKDALYVSDWNEGKIYKIGVKR
jgi:hypothetical protein